jgi:hypothetical protein
VTCHSNDTLRMRMHANKALTRHHICRCEACCVAHATHPTHTPSCAAGSPSAQTPPKTHKNTPPLTPYTHTYTPTHLFAPQLLLLALLRAQCRQRRLIRLSSCSSGGGRLVEC